MPREINRLTARFIAQVKEPGLYPDGNNLNLQVRKYPTKTGDGLGKSWIFRYRPRGWIKDRFMGLGSISLFSLAEARELARQLRQDLYAGIDPIDARKKERTKARLEAAKAMTFKACALAFVEEKKPGWRSGKHTDQWTNTLETYAFDTIGALPVQDVDVALVLKILRPIWTKKTPTASRLRGRIESVLDWAKASGLRTGENPARWQGHLDHILPAKADVRVVRHHPALEYKRVAAFMVTLREMEFISARALEFAILCATRTSETIGARWAEINFDEGVWTIPGERMKAKREHRVPLSARALEILQQLPREDENPFVFPGGKKGKPLSNMALLELLRGMEGMKGLTVHGFRSTFCDWVSEVSNFASDIREAALAHAIKDKTMAAYQRGDLLEKRRRMMNAWAGYCAKPPVKASGADIIAMQGARALAGSK